MLHEIPSTGLKVRLLGVVNTRIW